ncbi:uncharacterized protein [Leptinotarsa decemlineata]|uniref:uncharacterized protein n=1 Tax=Leptinotarsa decemlineata TaxID=7539 RepID=UPI003D305DC5
MRISVNENYLSVLIEILCSFTPVRDRDGTEVHVGVGSQILIVYEEGDASFTYYDTGLVYKGKDLKQLETLVNTDLERYHRWLAKNKLQINVKKTTFIISQKNMKQQDITVEIGGKEITRVHNTKYLGLIVDAMLE